ncbi:MAG TPA: hypothetical protein VF541_15005 [Longimicrobium sp.]|jgi:hypothetical protein
MVLRPPARTVVVTRIWLSFAWKMRHGVQVPPLGSMVQRWSPVPARTAVVTLISASPSP